MAVRNMSLEEFLKLANLGELHYYQKLILKYIEKLEGPPKRPEWPEGPEMISESDVNPRRIKK